MTRGEEEWYCALHASDWPGQVSAMVAGADGGDGELVSITIRWRAGHRATL